MPAKKVFKQKDNLAHQPCRWWITSPKDLAVILTTISIYLLVISLRLSPWSFRRVQDLVRRA